MMIILETLLTVDNYSRYLKQFSYSNFTSVLITFTIIYRMLIIYWLLFLFVSFYF